MESKNHTPFPALAFEGIDQFDQAFHVVVLKQTLQITAQGLQYADQQRPLCEEDEFFGLPNQSSVRQESDFCHFKPRCDVIVNGTAYAPNGPSNTVNVRLRVLGQPNSSSCMPAMPEPLGPGMPVSDDAMRQWRAEVSRLQSEQSTSTIHIDKTLIVTGERQLQHGGSLASGIGGLLRLGTLGLVNTSPWSLDMPSKFESLPIRYEYAYGGQCRIEQNDPAKQDVPSQFQTQRHIHPEGDDAPFAHSSLPSNPIGRGFAEPWYLKAKQPDTLPAPRITYPSSPFTLETFETGPHTARPDAEVAGFGIRAKSHPARARLAGTMDKAFIQSGRWLPDDFDFAIWNGAPLDQQCPWLQGDEVIELTNLCPLSTPGLARTAEGNLQLRLSLPGHTPFVRVRMESGQFFRLDLHLDTLILEPDQQQLVLTWRRIIGKEEGAEIRRLEMGQLSAAQRQRRSQDFAEFDALAQREVHSHG